MAVALLALVNVDSWRTTSVNAWVAVPTEFVAEMVTAYVPVAVGVPASVAVPLVFEVMAMPGGNPVAEKVGRGSPVVRTVKVKAAPSVALAVAALVKTGIEVTVSVNDWFRVPAAFVAVKVNG
jgi:hypothetical protein